MPDFQSIAVLVAKRLGRLSADVATPTFFDLTKHSPPRWRDALGEVDIPENH